MKDKFYASDLKFTLKQFNPENIMRIGQVEKFGHCQYAQKQVMKGELHQFDRMMVKAKEQSSIQRKCKNFVNLDLQKVCDFHKQVQKREFMISTDRLGVGGIEFFDPRKKANKMMHSKNSFDDGYFGENAANMCRQNYKRFKKGGELKRGKKDGGSSKKQQIKMTKFQENNRQKMAKILQQRSKRLKIIDDVNTKLKKKDDQQQKEKLQMEEKAKIKEHFSKIEQSNGPKNQDVFLEVSSRNMTAKIDLQKLFADRNK